ncbi:hypothetical protein EJ04DRAFT_563570 [Polyplosphaeria fusca]|uniref:BTB domain-containing protein n=1 Tax=Polyplosphaeria fusca TaxID=682080 RepID=A0A9P4QZB3_9PLEO|nr:hypothetical protein EJ04DRAFT_563570 [Polyplosphaeria fusca]
MEIFRHAYRILTIEKPKFSDLLTSRIVTVIVGDSKTFFLHADLLSAESEKFQKNLTEGVKTAKKVVVEVKDEDPDLFGFFVEYLYRDRSILSRDIKHHSEYVTLARLYAMGERLMAPKFQSYALWRFSESMHYSNIPIPDESLCILLQIALREIPESLTEDLMRSHIFWYAGTKISSLRKSWMFRAHLCALTDIGKQLCSWVKQNRPGGVPSTYELLYDKLERESEFGPEGVREADADMLAIL